MTPSPAELPEAFAKVPLPRIEELERERGRGLGAMIEEVAGGDWSIGTMRDLLTLIAPEREFATMGDLADAAQELLGSPGKVPGAATS